MALSAYAARIEKEHRLGKYYAWHAAMLGRMKNPPPLGRFIGETKKAVAQSPDEMLAAVRAWKARIEG